MRVKRWLFVTVFFLCAYLLFLFYPKHYYGGQFDSKDFEKGYTVYVKEGISMDSSLGDSLVIWEITDSQLKKSILNICMEVKPYRPQNSKYDVLPLVNEEDRRYYPSICFDAGEYGYYIERINWDNYINDQSNLNSGILKEKKGSPLLRMHKKDMSKIAYSDYPSSKYEFIASGRFDATDISEEQQEWYVELSEEKLELLSALLETITEKNAKIYKDIQLKDYYTIP